MTAHERAWAAMMGRGARTACAVVQGRPMPMTMARNMMAKTTRVAPSPTHARRSRYGMGTLYHPLRVTPRMPHVELVGTRSKSVAAGIVGHGGYTVDRLFNGMGTRARSSTWHATAALVMGSTAALALMATSSVECETAAVATSARATGGADRSQVATLAASKEPTTGGKARQAWLALLTRTLERCGPAFVKLGQWVSSRPDVFAADVCEALARLHHDVAPMPFTTVQRVVEDSLGEPIANVFKTFEEKPIGSGCIAQAHRATILTNIAGAGIRDVAVKVRRPEVEAIVALDLFVLARLAAAVDALPYCRPLRAPEGAAHFAEFMTHQLDLRREAANLDKFIVNFQSDERVAFPQPIHKLTREGLLVESFEKGESMSSILRAAAKRGEIIGGNVDRAQGSGGDERAWGEKGEGSELGRAGDAVLAAFLKMIFVDNFVHADLHPGNLLVRESGSRDGGPSVVLLDAGLVTTLTDADRRNFVDLVAAVAAGDGRHSADLMISRAGNEERVVDADGFRHGMTRIIDKVHATGFELREVQVGEVLKTVLGLVQRHKVHLDPVFSNIVLSIIVLEGVGRQLNPDLDLFKEISRILPKARRDIKYGAARAAKELVTA